MKRSINQSEAGIC